MPSPTFHTHRTSAVARRGQVLSCADDAESLARLALAQQRVELRDAVLRVREEVRLHLRAARSEVRQ